MTDAIDSRYSPIKFALRDTIVSRMESARTIIPGVALAGAVALVAKLLHSVRGCCTPTTATSESPSTRRVEARRHRRRHGRDARCAAIVPG